jgi:hypothetical protein
MRRIMLGAALFSVILLATPSATACNSCFRTSLVRFGVAEWVVVGKITTFEHKTVWALPHAGAPVKHEYAVGVLEITQALKGADGLTHLRIGLLPCQSGVVGKEACFFLFPHFQEAFFVMPRQFGEPLAKEGNQGFNAEMRLYQHWAELIKDPEASLKSRDADDRFVTAALLVSQYRNFVPGIHVKDRKAEPIDAEQSRLILRTFATADWDEMEERHALPMEWLFNRLGVTTKDGWDGGKFDDDENELHAAMKKWLADHSRSFRIAAFVQG